MTNYEYIVSSPEVLAEFINKVAYCGETIWSKPFYNMFCKICPTVHVKYDVIEDMNGKVIRKFEDGEKGSEDDLKPCEFSDGFCPNGDEIIWWLDQEYKQNER